MKNNKNVCATKLVDLGKYAIKQTMLEKATIISSDNDTIDDILVFLLHQNPFWFFIGNQPTHLIAEFIIQDFF